jgi:hypothetical protein
MRIPLIRELCLTLIKKSNGSIAETTKETNGRYSRNSENRASWISLKRKANFEESELSEKKWSIPALQFLMECSFGSSSHSCYHFSCGSSLLFL